MSDVAPLLARIRQALGRGETASPPAEVPSVPADLRPALAHTDLHALFIDNARKNGAEVLETSDREATLAAMLPEPAKVYRQGQLWTVLPFELDAAVVRGSLGIAASGAVVISSPDIEHRAVMAAPTLVVVLTRHELVATVAEALAHFGRFATPATRLFVSGPSKTADIEGVLITGVHGPGRLLILLEG